MLNLIKEARRVYVIGNGGSAANASHIANDLVLAGIKAHSLTDVSVITCIGNDFGYENIFSRQVELFCEPGDLLIALSGSGNSPNILKALESAKSKGVKTLAILGYQGGKARGLADYVIGADGLGMQDSEEQQITVGHEWLRKLRS